ncbi:YtxH domain-containing protein [Tuberibacillus sp. Marseille-P3662]|uniref:YtxH domain-containing protein n=1 Tax=Tuberibacillus sp. Marseille-P3662 TaxID=1965358 RepID=UPI00111C6B43|nr:YtxH domain-containing protein [Tuberibacillus sp. Marseille-P3662]
MTEQNDQTNNSSLNVKDFLIGGLIGGIVGASTAFLTAPKPGKDVRRDLADQSVAIKNRSSDFARTVSEQSSKVSDKAKELKARFNQDDQTDQEVPVDDDDDEIATTKEQEPVELR